MWPVCAAGCGGASTYRHAADQLTLCVEQGQQWCSAFRDAPTRRILQVAATADDHNFTVGESSDIEDDIATIDVNDAACVDPPWTG